LDRKGDEEELKAQGHYRSAKVAETIYSLGDDVYVLVMFRLHTAFSILLAALISVSPTHVIVIMQAVVELMVL
jgi:hypothetical protein